MSDIIIDLLTDNEVATNVLVTYCKWSRTKFPLNIYYSGKYYAKTAQVLQLLTKKNNFLTARSVNRDFYIQLGSLRLEDEGIRAEVVTDYRLLVTWLHNSSSIAATLLSNERSFNAYINSKFNVCLDSKYSLGYLINHYYNHQQPTSTKQKDIIDVI